MNVDHIHWYGHDSFRIEDGSLQIYIDPWELPADAPPADLVLVTHDHYDHFSEEDIRGISTDETQWVGPPDVIEKLGRGHPMQPGEEQEVRGIAIKAVPAYNVGKTFHPRQNNWLGYVLTLSDGQMIYHAGDSDHTPEMDKVKVDVALLPVSGTYVMTAREAAGAAERMKPKVVIPMHYDKIVGTRSDAEEFATLYDGETAILEAQG